MSKLRSEFFAFEKLSKIYAYLVFIEGMRLWS